MRAAIDTRFRRLPNGVLYRSVPAYVREEEDRKEYERSPEGKAEKRAARAAERLREKRLLPIGYPLDWGRNENPNAEREAKAINAHVAEQFDHVGVYDITDRDDKTVTREGIKVAAKSIFVQYEISGEDYGLEEGETATDGYRFLVYRDPTNPTKLVFESGC